MKATPPNFSQYSVLVAGAGSIGRRHLGNLRRLGVVKLAVSDPEAARLQAVAAEFGVKCVPDFPEALEQFTPDAVFVCSPPVFHVEQARQALRAKAHVFVEKPLSDRLDGVEALAAEARASGRVAQVGYNLRFHPGILRLQQCIAEAAVGRILWARAEVGQYLPDWRPSQDYRRNYTARRELGGGIILDASHEIDYVLWLLGAPRELICMAGKVSTLDVDVEDCATILLRLQSGTQADVHMDFVQRTYSRSCVLAGEEGTLLWDFEKNQVSIARPQIVRPQTVRPKVRPEILAYDFDPNRMYVAEVEHFFECMEENAAPRCGIADAKLTLQVALAARQSAVEKKWVSLD